MSVPRRRTAAALALALSLATFAAPTSGAVADAHHRAGHQLPGWQLRPTGSAEQFRGLDAVSHRVAWVGGSNGSVLRTVDGGRSWQDVSPDGSAGLLFRDVEARDRNHALVLAIGVGEASRIYRTADGGQTWSRVFTNHDPLAFYDCMTFLTHRRGLALSDPVNGKFRIIATDNGGRSWRVQPRAGMPAALDGEFGFAASGTCLTSVGPRDAWFASGGPQARVFHSRDAGRTWSVATTPVRATDSGGIFSLAFRDRRHGLAIGGDFLAPDQAVDALALTGDGGRTWRLVPDPAAPGGYRSGSAWVRPAQHRGQGRHGRHGHVALAVGPTGSDVSFNGGRTWRAFDAGSFDSVECTRDGSCWASGIDGRVARLRWAGR